jgi:hypothetical protein
MSENTKIIEPNGSFIDLFANITNILLKDLPTSGSITDVELALRRSWDLLRLEFLNQGISVNVAAELDSVNWPKASDGSFEITSQ